MTKHGWQECEVVFEPMGRVNLTPSQKKDRIIKNLKWWVAVFATADIIYTVLAVMIIWNGWLR